jgi:hypothetical protein
VRAGEQALRQSRRGECGRQRAVMFFALAPLCWVHAALQASCAWRSTLGPKLHGSPRNCVLAAASASRCAAMIVAYGELADWWMQLCHGAELPGSRWGQRRRRKHARCPQKCPFEAIMIINLPKDLEKETTHRYGPNSFKLHRWVWQRWRARTLLTRLAESTMVGGQAAGEHVVPTAEAQTIGRAIGILV